FAALQDLDSAPIRQRGDGQLSKTVHRRLDVETRCQDDGGVAQEPGRLVSLTLLGDVAPDVDREIRLSVPVHHRLRANAGPPLLACGSVARAKHQLGSSL